MSDKDPIIDLFESKLKNAEFEVDPSVWTNIASQIPAGSVASGSTGLSLTSKLLIAASVVTTVVITTVAFYIFKEKETEVQVNTVVNNENNTSIKESVLQEKRDEPLLLEKKATDQVDLSKSSEPQVEDQKELSNQNLTILSVDQIIDQEQLVAEDNLMEQFIDTPVQQTDVQEVIEQEGEEVQEEEMVTEQEEIVEASIEIKIPNVFTPNNDGQNDTYHLTFEGVINDVAVVIFDQKGDVVFRSSHADFQWDGMDLRGEPCPSGKYLFMMTGLDENGKEVLKSRDFQLLR